VTVDVDPIALERLFASHREPSDAPDVMDILPTRTPPRHRARRRMWKPPLEPVQAQHVQHSDALVR
jgi:hypothetical protein